MKLKKMLCECLVKFSFRFCEGFTRPSLATRLHVARFVSLSGEKAEKSG
jgi:hypothetical protein